jgi:hypothetical protein
MCQVIGAPPAEAFVGSAIEALFCGGCAPLCSLRSKTRGVGGGDASRADSSHSDSVRSGWASGRTETATCAAEPHLTILQAVTEAHAAERLVGSVC